MQCIEKLICDSSETADQKGLIILKYANHLTGIMVKVAKICEYERERERESSSSLPHLIFVQNMLRRVLNSEGKKKYN
jgi:hypothetical protein